MLQKTHAVVGTATALMVMRPDNIPEMMIGMGTALIGSVISDIDSGKSSSRRQANMITLFVLIITAAIIAMESYFHLGLFTLLKSDAGVMKLVISGAVFISVCIIGKQTAHRSFMHSFLCLAVLCACVWVLFKPITGYFAAAFASHLAMDMLNKKGVRVLYPFKFGFSFNICRADRLFNKVLFLTGLISTVAMVLFTLLKLYVL
ncbi:MAG: metal-dependent hydrolase [Clostridia bacterium]|nr:metal-dependent hydrolase [Clostridia bacterium]